MATRRAAVTTLLQCAVLAHPFSRGVLAFDLGGRQIRAATARGRCAASRRGDGVRGRAVQRRRPRQARRRREPDDAAARASPRSSACSTRGACSPFASIPKAASRSSAVPPRRGSSSTAGGLPDQGAERSGRDRRARRRESAGASRRTGRSTGLAMAPAQSVSPADIADRWLALETFDEQADGAAALGSRARVPDRAALQPRPRAAAKRRSAPSLGPATQDIGFRNRDGGAVRHRAVARRARFVCATSAAGPAWRRSSSGTARPRLSRAIEAARAGLLLPGSDLPRGRRDDPSAGRRVHGARAAAGRNTFPKTRNVDDRGGRAPRSTSASAAGSTRLHSAGIQATITSTPPAAATTRVRPKACVRKT